MKQILLHFFFFFISMANLFPQSPIVQQILNSSNQDSLVYFVRELSGDVSTIINGTTQTIVSRNKLQPGNALAETYIKQKLESYGLTTTIQSFSTTGKNVYAVQSGTEFPNQKYIICAHFDDMPSGTTAPGADDNASGTAGVIEAARILSQYSFPYTIIYALWDEEEQGLVGSNYYATQAAIAGDSILGVINMDMIAYDSNGDDVANIHTRPTAGNSDELKDKMVECNSLYGINLSLLILSPGSTYSDHASFWSNNYGAILLIEDDSDFNAYYHTVNDLVQYYNQSYYFKLAKLAYATLAEFALNLNLDIIHTPITSNTVSEPINTSAYISSGLVIGSGNLAPRLYFRTRIAGGSFGSFTSVMGIPAESGSYNFTIPSQPLGTVVQYYIAAQDANSTIVKTLPAGGSGYNPPGSIPPPAFFQFYVASQIVMLYDEANNLNDWASSGGWNITASKYVSPPTSFTDSPGGDYTNNNTAVLKYNNQIGLTDILGASLEFDTQWDIEDNWDYGQVQISTDNGISWTALEGLFTNPGTGSFQPNGEPLYDGAQLSWVHENIDISSYVNQNISLRFLFMSDGSVTADGWYVDNIKITTFTSISTFSLSVSVSNGWNMVSVPGVNPNGQGVDFWWPGKDPAASVFKYSNGYIAITTAAPGEGYWMKNVGANIYNTGDEWPEIQIVPHDPINCNGGWNLIGVYENPVDTSNIIGIIPPVYGYFGGYQVVDTLFPGFGYFVRCNGPIIIPDILKKQTEAIVAEYIKNDWGKITITDNAGRSYTLYAITGEVDLNQYELPPMPPAGMFDIRYGSGRIAEDINSGIQSIEMTSLEYPVTVRIENMDIRLQDESGKEINENVKSGEQITINNTQINKLMVSGEVIPDVYALEQNYPNPFNPSTTIKFSVPKQTKLKINVYNILGELVQTIIEGLYETGYHQVKFDAQNLPSGIYIYRMESNETIQSMKMILLK